MEFFMLHRRHPGQRARLMQSMHRIIAIVTVVMTIVQTAGVDGGNAFFSVPQAHAATGIFAPINYQGKITAINGTAVADGKYNMRFKIYDAPTGGTLLWSETWNTLTQQVTMTGGLFSVALGTQVAMTGSVNFNSDNLYLQVEFDPANAGTYPEVFSPRRRFGSVPYAHNADTIDGLDSRQFVRTDIAQTMSGTLTIKPNDFTKIGLDIVSTAGSSTAPGLRISTQGAPGIVFGSGGTNYDTNLYRFKASILKTDNSLYVAGALSGATVHAEQSLTTSGTLVFEGAASGSSLYLGSSLKGAGLTDCSTSTTSKLLWNSATGRFSCGTDQNTTAWSNTGSLQNGFDNRYVKKSGDTMTGALTINVTGGSPGTIGLKILNTLTGAVLHAEKNLTSSGTLAIKGVALFENNVNVQGTLSGKTLTIMNNNSYLLGNVGIGKSGTPNSKLEVVGTISGSTVYATNALRSSGSIVAEGTISGSDLFVGNSIKGAGLTDCSTSTTSKLLWNSATGRFSCGTDQNTTAWSNTGSLQNGFDNRYVKKSGDTMTGALNIRPTAGAGIVGLNIAAAMSGRSLVIEGTGSSPLLYTDLTHGRLGIGTTSPQKQLEINGVEAGLLVNATVGTARLIFKNAGVEHAQITEGITGLPRDLSITNAGGNELLTVNTDSGRVAIGSGHVVAKATLDVLGTISGSILYGNNSVNSSGSITAEGTISGANLFVGNSIKGAGLANCNTTTSALQWNSSTGRFSCGTITAGTSFSTGQVITIGDARYVKKSGDTMTGALNIRPTAGAGIVGLNVAATMSGRNLVVEGSGASPLIYTTGGYVGLGTTTPGAVFNIVSHNPTLNPDIIFQKDSGFLLYTSDVYSSVNALQSPQWITRRARGTSASPASVQNGDQLGLFGFRGYSGTGFVQDAWINAIVDQPVGNGKVPTALTFATSPNTSQPTERMRITSSGSVGIGTNSPGSKLSVSGSVIIGNSIGSAAADANVGLEVLSTISGSTVYATNALRSSGSIVAEGTISGANLFIGNSIKGAGLTDCTTATSAVQWSSSTGRFSCGANVGFSSGKVITIGDARYVKKSGDTMTGALIINVTGGNVGTIGLKVINTMSGAIVHAEKNLTSSGTLVIKGIATFQNNVFVRGTLSGSLIHAEKFLTSSGSIVAKKDVYAYGTVLTRYGVQMMSGALMTELSGFNDSIDLEANLSIHGITRMTTQGNLVNIGSIQGGAATLTAGGTFAAKVDYTTNSTPYGTAVADLNGDGKPDIVTANHNFAGTLSVFINNGSGTFAPQVNYSIPNAALRVAVGDLNGDGKPDIAVTNGSTHTISVLMNYGNGTFAPKVDYALNSSSDVVIGDLNGDGKADLAAVNNGNATLSILMNNGDGTFASNVDYTTNSGPTSLAIGDFNGDGKPDLAIADTSAAKISVFFNQGNGTFGSRVDYPTGSLPADIVTGDFNGDNKPDVLVINSGDNTMSLFRNTGTGSFAARTNFTTGVGPQELALGDFNGDGKLDAAVTNGTDNNVSIMLNSGTGSFISRANYTAGTLPQGVAVGDFNGDGKPDLAVANQNSNTESVFMNITSQTVSTFSNSGALAVVNKTRTGTGIYAFSSGSAVLALEAGTQSGSKTPDILFGYKGNFDTKITRTGTGALTFQSNTGVLLTLNTGMTNAKQDVFRIISQVSDSHGSPPNNLVFRVNGSGAVYSDSTYNSNGADYAEWFYDGNQNLQPGEIVCIDVTRNNAVKRCSRDGDSDVMGVVSSHPAFIGNTITGAEGLMPPGYVLVGLIGQVPTKVMVSGTGTIHPGDQLTAASTPGYARKAMPGESTLGVALEGIDHGTGTINVLISRRNSSMTVDTVNQKVLDTIASMKIGDEVQTMVAGAVQNLNVNDQVDLEVQKQLSAIQATGTDIKTLQSEIDDLKSKLAVLESQSGSTTTVINNTTQTGAKLSADISAQTMTLEKTLMVGGDTHIGGDLHLDGALVASDILVPGGIAIDGGETVNGDLAATTLHVNSGAEINGALTINGNLRINSGSLLFGSGALQLSDLIVQKALVVLGNITINGLATFLGDVSIKGELSVSNRQAGFAMIPRTGTSVTVLFGSGGLNGTPVVTASPDAPVLYAVTKTTQTGFTIQLAIPAVADIRFSWLALTTDMPGTQTGSVVADSSTIFPLASDNIPVSSDMVWNACIRNIAMFDASGKAISCSRYHDSYTWHQPDLQIDFLWNTDLTPPLLVVPDGYTTKVTEDAAQLRAAITGSSETDGADTPISSESSVSSGSSDSSLAIEPVTTDSSSTSSIDSMSSAASVTSDTSATSENSSASSVITTKTTSSTSSDTITNAASSTTTTTDAATSSAPAATTDTASSSGALDTTGTDAATQTN